MSIQSDVRDILEVFLIANLNNITQNTATNLNIPLGLQEFIGTQVLNNIGTDSYQASFSSDLRQLLSTFVLNNITELENDQ